MDERDNNFKYMLKKVSSLLCKSIYSFISDRENSYKPYSRDDIKAYMGRSMEIVKKKHPMFPEGQLDKCIDFVIKKMDNDPGLYFFKDGKTSGEVSERNSKEKGMSDDEVVKGRIERDKSKLTDKMVSQCRDPKDPANRISCRNAVDSKSDMSHDWHRLYGHELRRGGNNKEGDFERANKRMVKRYGTDEVSENVVRLNETQLRNLIKESVKKVMKESMNELSPEFLINAKNKFKEKYGETGLRNRDWSNFVNREHYQKGRGYNDIFDQKPEWDKKREENGVKSDPYDLKTYRLRKNGEKDYIRPHLNNFDRAISSAMHSPEYSDYLDKLTAGLDPLTAAAVKVYYPGDLDWGEEDMFDNYEHGYGEFGDAAEAEDDNGKIWKFYRTYSGHNEGGSIEVDELEDIEFESPDGETGSIPSKFWYTDY